MLKNMRIVKQAIEKSLEAAQPWKYTLTTEGDRLYFEDDYNFTIELKVVDNNIYEVGGCEFLTKKDYSVQHVVKRGLFFTYTDFILGYV